MGARDERLEDLFFEDQTPLGNPTEEGQTRYVGGDLVAFLGGTVKSLTLSTFPPATAAGQLLISKDGLLFTREIPVVSPDDGWLANIQGELLIEGLTP